MKGEDRVRELAIKSQRREDAQVIVSVSDTGVGLPPQRADQIFNAFFTKPYGTGIGSRISRSIVEVHGGRLWANNNYPRGATFRLTLPTETRQQRLQPVLVFLYQEIIASTLLAYYFYYDG